MLWFIQSSANAIPYQLLKLLLAEFRLDSTFKLILSLSWAEPSNVAISWGLIPNVKWLGLLYQALKTSFIASGFIESFRASTSLSVSLAAVPEAWKRSLSVLEVLSISIPFLEFHFSVMSFTPCVNVSIERSSRESTSFAICSPERVDLASSRNSCVLTIASTPLRIPVGKFCKIACRASGLSSE